MNFLAKYTVEARIAVAIITVLSGISCSSTPPDPAPANAAPNPTAAAERIKEADGLYDQREDLNKVRTARGLLRQAQMEDQTNYEATWKLARANYYIAAHTDNDDERDEGFTEGIAFGKAAVQLQDAKPEGHFWLAANQGGDAEHSTLAGLTNFDDIRRELETVLKLDEKFQAGSAYLGLGRLYLRAPRVLGGDTQKAIDYLEKGLKVSNNNALMHSTLAEAYHAAGREADARKQIELLEQMKPDPKFAAEYNEAMADVKKVKEKMESKR